MTLCEFYEKIGSNYKEITDRLVKESRIQLYLTQFAADDAFASFIEQYNSGLYEEAFRTVHNIKGLALNLNLTPLIGTGNIVCEALRHGKPQGDISDLIEDLKQAYELVVSNIALLDRL